MVMMTSLWLLAPPLGWAQDRSLLIETYNVGLAHGFVDAAEERIPLLQQALARDPADLLCLQEVWEDRDRQQIADALAVSHPHIWTLPITQHRASEAPACRWRELFGEDRFVSCMTGDCGGLDGDAFTDCVVQKCGPVLTRLRDENPQCANAIMAQVGKSALRGLWTVIRPLRRANLYAYGGSDGLMLLSRVPLQNTGHIDFTDIATLNRRRALYADVPLGGTLTRVYCTHLTAMLDAVAPYPGPFESWAAENLAQIDRLLEHAATFPGPVVLAGDFNTGPGILHPPPALAYAVEPEAPASHERVLAAGFVDPVAALRLCTYCGGENRLTSPDDAPALLDHLYLRGLDASDTRRTHDQPVPFLDGKDIPLSDHYGMSARLSLPTPAPAPAPE